MNQPSRSRVPVDHRRESVGCEPAVPSGISGAIRSSPTQAWCIWTAALLAVVMFLVDFIGASHARSMTLTIVAIQSGGQLVVMGTALLLGRYSSSMGKNLRSTVDLTKLERLIEFASGIVLVVVSIPVAYRAVGCLYMPGDCDALESVYILFFGVMTGCLSTWLLLRAVPTRVKESLGVAAVPRLRDADAGDLSTSLACAMARGQFNDVQISLILLVFMVVSSALGRPWLDALAGVVGAFSMSWIASRLIISSGAELIGRTSNP